MLCFIYCVDIFGCMELIDTNALAAQLTCDCQSGSIKGHDWEMIVLMGDIFYLLFLSVSGHFSLVSTLLYSFFGYK